MRSTIARVATRYHPRMTEPSIRRALRAPRALLSCFAVLVLAGCNAEPSVVQQADPAEPAVTSNDQAVDAVPVIASDEATFDFGTVSPTGKVEHVFKLVNRGGADLHIERVERT